MTHFRCAVFSYDPNRFDMLLAPYNEQDEKYFEFISASANEETLRADYAKNRDKWLERDPDSEYPEFDEWLVDIGYVRENGRIGYYGNPDAQWDWYTLNGGDWQFEMKPGEKYDDRGYARKNQFVYYDSKASMEDIASNYAKYQDDAENSDSTYRREQSREMLKAFPTLGEFAAYTKWIFPYAYITPDGKWHSPGRVGWFGMSSDSAQNRKEYLQEWIKWIESSDNPYVNFVDCHI